MALGLVSFGASAAPAHAQTNFSATYNTFRSLSNTSTPGVSLTLLSGETNNAPDGLTNLTGFLYTQVNPVTGNFSFNTDPTAFGLQAPAGSVVFFGNNRTDSLITTGSGTGLFNFNTQPVNGVAPFTEQFSGTFTVTGGQGRFSGATGTLTGSAIDTFTPDRVPSGGQFSVTGSIETVPEPNTSRMTLIGMGVMGAGFVLRRSSFKQSAIALKKSKS